MNIKIIIIAAAVALGIAGILVAVYTQGPPITGLTGQSFSQGAFVVDIIQDSPQRFVASVQNNGATLENSGAFIVKRDLGSDCEPHGVLLANFQIVDRNGVIVPQPDIIMQDSSVTIDSEQAGYDAVPFGPQVETMAYVLRLEPDSVQVADLLQEIPIQKQNFVELFDSCLQGMEQGYPLLIRVLNPQSNSSSYISMRDTAGNSFETSLFVSRSLPESVAEIFWPDNRNNWMSANFTRLGGSVPAYNEAPSFNIKVTTVLPDGSTQEGEHNIALRQDDLREYSFDYLDVITGKVVPTYPKYWEIQLDMRDGSIS